MRQAGSKEYAHELLELLPGGQVPAVIEMLESMVGTRHLALIEDAPAEKSWDGSLWDANAVLGHGELISHAEFLADHGGPAED
jgi:hypothetical protein